MPRDMDALKKIVIATENSVFDFELFIGERSQKQRAGSISKVPTLLQYWVFFI